MNKEKETADPGSASSSQPIKQKIKDGIVALSLSNLCFVGAWFSPLSDADYGFFNTMRLPGCTLLALLTNIFGLALMVWLVLQALHRSRNGAFHFAVHLMFFALLFLPLDFIRAQFHPAHSLTSLAKQPVGMLAGAVVVAFVLWKHRLIARAAAIIVAIFSPLAVVTVTRIVLLYLGVTHLRESNSDPTFSPLSPVHPDQPRIVWIIFDELDYRLVFEQPPTGYQFPEFSRLRNECLSANNAVSPADRTIISMPSLMAGRRIISVALTNSSDLFLTLYKTGSVVDVEQKNFSQLPNIFSLAHARSVNTAVVGWYVPYGRLLSTNLNHCVWYAYPSFEPTRARTYTESLWNEIEGLLGPLHIQHRFVRMYQEGMKESLSIVTNGEYGLTLLHLNPPHAPGFYLPETGRYSLFPETGTKAYFNNVVLADHSLGQLRRTMESSGQWDKTWVIVSADHSWRMSNVYDGKRDFRVPFLVKPPGNNPPVLDSQEFNTAVTSSLIMAIFDRQLTNTTDVSAWLTQHAKPRPTTHGKFIEGKYAE